MNSIHKISAFFQITIVKHILFWIGIIAYFFFTVEMKYFTGLQEVFETRIIIILMQIMFAYSLLLILVPKFLIPKKYFLFTIGVILMLMLAYFTFVTVHEFYFQPKYWKLKGNETEYKSVKSFWFYITRTRTFIGKSIKFATPALLLLMIKFYKDQQKYLKLNEQKKTAELTTLKQQLNPHFLFNTLNNLYALSIKKSDQAPEVIAKLSEMLDYMLYGCNEKFVSLFKEVELIENYLALEKVRYGNRVKIQFHKRFEKEVKIAPLILLTFIENAFKHGVSQELKEAEIEIKIYLENSFICFQITNSIPTNKVASTKERIGLKNVKKQLELLYPDAFDLQIEEKESVFKVNLKLEEK
ncbi:sensor histidine kinase [Aureivirga marina]|uniref:sensor histidine kinase n=1 Tax=Aureivirga marina TaxID=1182451 RepID=UPI0018C99B1F|nr:sensor histidine kinase [Aureivirga marina]